MIRMVIGRGRERTREGEEKSTKIINTYKTKDWQEEEEETEMSRLPLWAERASYYLTRSITKLTAWTNKSKSLEWKSPIKMWSNQLEKRSFFYRSPESPRRERQFLVSKWIISQLNWRGQIVIRKERENKHLSFSIQSSSFRIAGRILSR